MANLEGDYSLNGFYLLAGTKGLQEGNIHFFPDGKAIGTMGDDNKKTKLLFGPQGPTPRKILIGYMSPEKELYLLKIPDLHQMTQDVIWALKEKDKTKLTFKGGYTLLGRAGTSFAVALIPGLEDILTTAKIPDNNSLIKLMSGVNSKILSERIFTKENYKLVMVDSASCEQVGEITLKKI